MDMDFDMNMDLEHEQDQKQVEVDPLDGQAYLTFPMVLDRHERCAKLCTMEIGCNTPKTGSVIKTR
ncbi:hypothetical protein Hdeb2414_s0265g00852001 [Helianthus debilis subsp. tardiflorus]